MVRTIALITIALMATGCDQLARDTRAESAMVSQLDHGAPSTAELVREYYHEDALCPSNLEGRAYYRNRHCSRAEKVSDVLDARGLCLMENRFYVACDVNQPYRERH